MRDSVMWVMLLVACAVVGILGYRYYRASEQIALLTERTGQLSAELEGVGEVHKLTEAKSAKEVRQAEGDITKLTRTKEKLRAEVRGRAVDKRAAIRASQASGYMGQGRR